MKFSAPVRTTRRRCVTTQVHRAGFTLSEVLIVLAVIGILAAVLLPLISSVRETGRSATCQSNLRQIHLGLQFYLGDSQRRYPPFGRVKGDSQCAWPDLLISYVQAPAIFQCPSAAHGEFVPGCPEDTSTEDDPPKTISYNGSYGLSWLRVPGVVGTSETRLQQPSGTILVIEADTQGGGFVTPGAEIADGKTLPISSSADLQTLSVAVPGRHHNRNNVLFADGHVKQLPLEKLINTDIWFVQK